MDTNENKSKTIYKRPVSLLLVIILGIIFLSVFIPVAISGDVFGVGITLLIFSIIFGIISIILISVNRNKKKRFKGFLTSLASMATIFIVSIVLIGVGATNSKTSESSSYDTVKNENLVETEKYEIQNKPPIADAGEDIKCYTGNKIILDAGNSLDPDNDKLTYTWTLGKEEYDGKILNLIMHKSGVYYLSLTVSDGKSLDNDMAKIIVESNKEVTQENPEVSEKETEQDTQAEEGANQEEAVQEKSIEDKSGFEEVYCTRIVDGDTIEIQDNTGNIYKVRYIGMDTPESGDPYFAETALANKVLVEGKTIRLEKDVSETDQYGRLLRYVYVGDLFINAHLVAEGFAMVSTYPPDVKYADYFLELQQQARDSNKGLWGLVVEEETNEQLTIQGKYCGSVKSDVYHYPNCGYVETIKLENLIWFIDESDARSKGYRPCKKCCPP